MPMWKSQILTASTWNRHITAVEIAAATVDRVVIVGLGVAARVADAVAAVAVEEADRGDRGGS